MIPPPRKSLAYPWYVVAVLTTVFVLSFVDRQILSMLVKPIRRDLGISDTGMSVLMGFSFAVFYTFFGIPLGRMADSRSRRGMIAAGLTAWSLFTAGCGLAQNYVQILLLRVGVGVGEASLSPAAFSLISDYFPPSRLSTAVSVYAMGAYIGTGLSTVLGGVVVSVASKQELWILPLVGATRPWQVIFFMVGLPGLLFSLVMFTVREPERKLVRGSSKALPLSEVFAYVRQNGRTFFCHNAGFGLIALAVFGNAAWIPEFFRRVHHWDIAKAGVVYGSTVAIFSPIGMILTGRVADEMRSRGVMNANLKLAAWLASGFVVLFLAAFLSPSGTWAAILMVPGAMITAGPFGIAAASVQQMTPAPMRGQASAIYLFVANLIGMGLGPTAVAAINQYVFQRDDALNYSLAIVVGVAGTGGALLLRAGWKPFLESMERLKEWNAVNV